MILKLIYYNYYESLLAFIVWMAIRPLPGGQPYDEGSMNGVRIKGESLFCRQLGREAARGIT